MLKRSKISSSRVYSKSRQAENLTFMSNPIWSFSNMTSASSILRSMLSPCWVSASFFARLLHLVTKWLNKTSARLWMSSLLWMVSRPGLHDIFFRKSNTLQMLMSGHGPFLFCRMMGSLVLLNSIHLMWYVKFSVSLGLIDWVCRVSAGLGSTASDCVASCCSLSGGFAEGSGTGSVLSAFDSVELSAWGISDWVSSFWVISSDLVASASVFSSKVLRKIKISLFI